MEKEYTISELTQELGICKMTAYKLLRSGQIKARKRYGTTHSGDTWLVSQSALDEYREQKNSRCAVPKLFWIDKKCEKCGNETSIFFALCSNCNSLIFTKSYNVNFENIDKQLEEKNALLEIPDKCHTCGAKIKK